MTVTLDLVLLLLLLLFLLLLVLHVYSFLCTADGAAVDGRWAATRTPIAASIREGRRERGSSGTPTPREEGTARRQRASLRREMG